MSIAEAVSQSWTWVPEGVVVYGILEIYIISIMYQWDAHHKTRQCGIGTYWSSGK